MKFLEQVARYYVEKYDRLENYIMVFPNKRSAMFMKKYMQELLVKTTARPYFMPRFQTMGNFVSRFAPYPEMARDEQLFLLYDCYRRLLTRLGRDSQLRDFDKFIFWGGMILDDFDDVDRQLVDAGKLFKNLRDLKEINSDYLDDEQKKIVRRIWGESARTEAVTNFWTHVTNVDGDNAESRFVALWQLLGELYADFKDAVHSRGFDTAGGQYREAVAAVKKIGFDEVGERKIAFIGFEDLTHSETLIFDRLKDLGVADFFWDFDSKMLEISADKHLKSRIKALLRNFAMPEDFDFVTSGELPQIEVLAVPSGIAQTKASGDVLQRWNDEGFINPVGVIDTAVVLPDENLLMPQLLSIPEDIASVNITMGVAFETTAFASMLRSIISMQLRAREIHKRVHYYVADVMEVLSHPHIQVIAPETAEKIKKTISESGLFNLDAQTLVDGFPQLAFLFTPVKAENDAESIAAYMTGLIDGIGQALDVAGSNVQGGLPELAILETFRTGIERLNGFIHEYAIVMNENTYFALFERLMRQRRVDLQGTPLRGLQLMGVLETRALDFDNVVILSMNENSFPRKSYMRTMIPNNLRIGYGMSTIDRQDSLYTYYFYRLLSRAKRVTLIYDSRTGSFGAGEPSRYIAQLRHVMPAGKITSRSLQFSSDFNTPQPITVEKDEAVMAQLDNFKPGGKSYLSASALKEYKKCRLRFYLRYVKNLRGEDNVTEYISPAAYGTIMHKIVETLYRPYEYKTVTADVIAKFLNTRGFLEDLIAKTVFEMYYSNSRYTSAEQMPAEGAVTCSIINLYLRKMLEIERDEASLHPFKYIKGEMGVKSPAWEINDELSINFKMSIDRVDEIGDGMLRFIDYKTGSDKVAPTKIENLFKRGRHDDDAVFQLLTYCIAYRDMVDSTKGIKPLVYPFRIMASTDKIPEIVIDKEIISDYRMVEDEFSELLFEMIEEIFSQDVPFDQAEDAEGCGYCPFIDLCGRNVVKY